MYPFSRRSELTVLLGILGLFLVGVAIGVAANNALGYDESAYALLSRHWMSGTPTNGWGIHRPPLLSALGLVPIIVGRPEWAFRLVGAAFGVATVVGVWWFARSQTGPIAGLIAALAVAAASPFQVESGVFLTDVPSTCVLMLLTGLLWQQLRSQAPIGARFLWLAPVAATAFYLRYGAVIPLAALALAAVLVAGPRLVTSWRIVAATVGLFALLLVPHVVIATMERGVPWGILVTAQTAAEQASDGLPLAQYAVWLPSQLMGPLGALVATTGVVAMGRSLAKTRAGSPAEAERRRFRAFAAVAVLVQMAMLGTIIHAEARYVFFVMALLIVVGADALANLARSRDWSMLARPAMVFAPVILFLGVGMTVLEARDRGVFLDWKREVGVFIGQHAGGNAL